MSIAILARERYCARLLEYFSTMDMGKVAYTPAKEYDSLSLAIFIFSGTEEECREVEIWIKGMFNSFDVLTYRFATEITRPLIGR